jgi:hypothetical protein
MSLDPHRIVIPGRAQREPGISRFRVWSHRSAQSADSWDHPGMTDYKLPT